MPNEDKKSKRRKKKLEKVLKKRDRLEKEQVFKPNSKKLSRHRRRVEKHLKKVDGYKF